MVHIGRAVRPLIGAGQRRVGLALVEALLGDDAVGEVLGTTSASATSAQLDGLRALPDAMQGVLDQREVVAEAAARLAPSRRRWVLKGSSVAGVAGWRKAVYETLREIFRRPS